MWRGEKAEELTLSNTVIRITPSSWYESLCRIPSEPQRVVGGIGAVEGEDPTRELDR